MDFSLWILIVGEIALCLSVLLIERYRKKHTYIPPQQTPAPPAEKEVSGKEDVPLRYKTKGNASPHGKPRIYFTCHPRDFDACFEKVCEDIFKTHDCAIYYTEDMSAPISEQDKATDLGSNLLFVIPVTFKLLTTPCRAMDEDFPYAVRNHIPVLPILIETGIDQFYSRRDKFADLQYLNPYSTDQTEISYEDKLKRFLDSVLIGDETAQRIRAAFTAYIFLSYRKKDRRYANELMQMIHRTPNCRDIAVWFDEFLSPGEDFRKNIENMLRSSKLFTLLVTPNLLEEPGGSPNFVMAEEYPAALGIGIDIFPVEMEKTDFYALGAKFPGIPQCADVQDRDAFQKRLLAAVEKILSMPVNRTPEHSFLIGLAYLNGIDVEVDRQRAVALISDAAEAQLPEAMAQLYHMYDSGLGVSRNYHEAVKWAEKLVAYYRQSQGAESESTLLWLQNTAYSHYEAGEYVKALTIYKDLCSLSCKVSGEENQNTMTAQYNLALCYQALHKHAKAAEIINRLYLLRRRVLGPDHVDTIASMIALSTSYANANDNEQALNLAEEAHRQSLEVLGEVHSITLQSLHNLAYIHGNLKNYTQALDAFNTVYRILCNSVGEKHPNTLIVLSNIAHIYSCMNNEEQALRFNEEAYKRICEVLGENHPSSIISLNNLAYSYMKTGNGELSLKLQEKAYALLLRNLGEEHPDVIKMLENIAIVYCMQEKYATALPLMEKVYTLRCKVMGTEDTSTLESLAIRNAIQEKVGS